MANKKTLVLGASTNEERYSYLAIKSLIDHGHEVYAIGKRPGHIDEVEIYAEEKIIPNIDTVTLYLNAQNQAHYYDYILALNPKRIIFNPGAENPQFAKLASTKGIIIQNACTLVLLSTGQY